MDEFSLSASANAPRGKVVLVHLASSIVVATLIGILVFRLWFPDGLAGLSGGWRLFWWIVGVDVVCGPLLTLLLYKQSKPGWELLCDLFIVVAIQSAALGYGLYTLAQARPLALVFEVDRFRLISSADIVEADLKYLPEWFKPWSTTAIRMVGLRPPLSKEEHWKGFEAALQGVESGQRPQRWQDFAKSRSEVMRRARPLADLQAAHPDQQELIAFAAKDALKEAQPGEEAADGQALLWLPLVSRRSMGWVVLLDPASLRVRAYLPIDGFQ